MFIKNLKLQNFRNYSDISVDFDPKNNVIHGLNAQGKTNLIESIYFLSTFKSFRTSKNRELIKLGHDNMSICCDYLLGNRDYNIKIYYFNSKYKIFINGVEYKSRNKIHSLIKTVVFCPDDLLLVKNSAEYRRKFLDDTICQFRPKYRQLITEYYKVLREKNFILRHPEKNLYYLLDDYNFKIAKLGGEISFIRKNFIELLNTQAKEIYSDICGGVEILSTSYCSKAISYDENSANKFAENIASLLNIYREKEISAKNSLIGIHKDDILFKIDNKNAREFASQGQVRSIILALKLGVREMFFLDTKEHAILILDDVLSELDTTRQDFVLNKISDGQVIITTPYDDKINILGRKIEIFDGNLKG